MSSELRALVVGGTGAVGRHVVGELLRSKACATICLFARILNRARFRRSLPWSRQLAAVQSPSQTSTRSSRTPLSLFRKSLVRSSFCFRCSTTYHRQSIISDFDALPEDTISNHDVVFCALGSTRKQAGSAVSPRVLCFAFPSVLTLLVFFPPFFLFFFFTGGLPPH